MFFFVKNSKICIKTEKCNKLIFNKKHIKNTITMVKLKSEIYLEDIWKPITNTYEYNNPNCLLCKESVFINSCCSNRFEVAQTFNIYSQKGIPKNDYNDIFLFPFCDKCSHVVHDFINTEDKIYLVIKSYEYGKCIFKVDSWLDRQDSN